MTRLLSRLAMCLTLAHLVGACAPPSTKAGEADGATSTDGSTVADAGAGACTDDSQCPAMQYCAGNGCGTPGACAPLTTDCGQTFAPVCGCDGRTYPNECVAGSRGVRVAEMGRCGRGGDGGGFPPPMGDGGFPPPPGDGGFPPPGGTMCGNLRCGRNELCCEATQSCYNNRCTDCCAPNAKACATNADCDSQQYCAGAGCGTSGFCEARPPMCPPFGRPVCGCDGQTYMTDCDAQQAGVRTASNGICPDSDAGMPMGIQCGLAICQPGQACCAATNTCYAATCTNCCSAGSDAGSTCTSNSSCGTTQYCAGQGCGTSGMCEDRPTTCPSTFAPVCGCDGNTYENECAAQASGTRAASNGACGADAGP